jgi:UDP-3-O-[3-hydroxymyristoyl] glucosamine N-acyltransferase
MVNKGITVKLFASLLAHTGVAVATGVAVGAGVAVFAGVGVLAGVGVFAVVGVGAEVSVGGGVGLAHAERINATAIMIPRVNFSMIVSFESRQSISEIGRR